MLFALGIPALLAALLIAYWSSERGAIDTCLDRGGRYDYASKSCDLK
jgi:hypothetical protein